MVKRLGSLSQSLVAAGYVQDKIRHLAEVGRLNKGLSAGDSFSDSLSASKEIPPPVVRYTKFRYGFPNSPLLFPILNQISPAHGLHLISFKINFKIILPSTPRFPKWPLSLRFLHYRYQYSENLRSIMVILHEELCKFIIQGVRKRLYLSPRKIN